MVAEKNLHQLENHVSGQANKPLSRPAHSLSFSQVIEETKADADDGLTDSEAKKRVEEYGRNELGDHVGIQPVKILVRQIANAMTLVCLPLSLCWMEERADPTLQVLILAMAVSFGIGSWIEGGVITAVIILNIVVGFFQEFQAEKTMDSLRSLSSPTASAVREGRTITVPTAEIVPGDMVEIKTGDTIPADIREVNLPNKLRSLI
jgi:Na+-exporting ATPase